MGIEAGQLNDDAGGGGGGAGSSISALRQRRILLERGDIEEGNNEVADAFNLSSSPAFTKDVDVEIANSALRAKTSALPFNDGAAAPNEGPKEMYRRSRLTNKGSSTGILSAVITPDHFGSKTGGIASTGAGTATVDFISEEFKDVIAQNSKWKIYKLRNQFGDTEMQTVKDAGGADAEIIILTVGNPNAGETQVTFSDTGLTSDGNAGVAFGLTGQDQADEIKFIPWEWIPKSNNDGATDVTPTIVSMAIAEPDTIKFQGAADFTLENATGLTHTVVFDTSERSPDGRFVVKVTQEQNSSNFPTWYFLGSDNNNTGPAQLIGTIPGTIGLADTSFNQFHKACIAVSNNGLVAVSISQKHPSAVQPITNLVGFDLSDPTPALTFLDFGLTSGFTGGETHPMLAGDEFDATEMYIATLGRRTDNQTLARRFIMTKNTGNPVIFTEDSTQVTLPTQDILISGNRPSAGLNISGTGTSHKMHMSYTDSGAFFIRAILLNEGSASLTSYNGGANLSSGSPLTGSPARIEDSIIAGTNWVINYRVGNDNKLRKRFVPLSSTSFADTEAIISENSLNHSQGESLNDYAILHKRLRNTMRSSPSDSKRIFTAVDSILNYAGGSDGISRSSVIEIKDIETVGSPLVNSMGTSPNSQMVLGGNAATQKTAQSFTSSGGFTLRSITLATSANFDIETPENERITIAIYGDDGGGLPDLGNLIVSGVTGNGINPRLLTQSGTTGTKQAVSFNFPETVLADIRHHAVWEGQTSDVGYIGGKAMHFPMGISGLPGEQASNFNGTVWAASGSSRSFGVTVQDYWIHDRHSKAQHSSNAKNIFGVDVTHAEAESALEYKFTNNDSFLLLTNRLQTSNGGTGGNTLTPLTGHVYKSIISISNDGNPSTFTDPIEGVYGPSIYDENVKFCVINGGRAEKNRDTGAEALGRQSLDVAGWDEGGGGPGSVSYSNIGAPQYISIPSFKHGVGVNKGGGSTAFTVQYNTDFISSWETFPGDFSILCEARTNVVMGGDRWLLTNNADWRFGFRGGATPNIGWDIKGTSPAVGTGFVGTTIIQTDNTAYWFLITRRGSRFDLWLSTDQGANWNHEGQGPNYSGAYAVEGAGIVMGAFDPSGSFSSNFEGDQGLIQVAVGPDIANQGDTLPDGGIKTGFKNIGMPRLEGTPSARAWAGNMGHSINSRIAYGDQTGWFRETARSRDNNAQKDAFKIDVEYDISGMTQGSINQFAMLGLKRSSIDRSQFEGYIQDNN